LRRGLGGKTRPRTMADVTKEDGIFIPVLLKMRRMCRDIETHTRG
jgi:hypothetical protein